MNPTETFPHVADPGTYTPRFAQCRCGSVRLRVSNIDAPRSWGENCPAALREALEAERGRSRRYANHLDDIRCDILDIGHPLGDDSDQELTPRRLVREVLTLLAETRRGAWTLAGDAAMADMEREEESDAMFLRLTEAEKERDAALARVAELEVVVNAARVLREDIRTIHEDDPDTGLCPICGTAEHEVGCTVPALDEALASLQYEALAARSAGGGAK